MGRQNRMVVLLDGECTMCSCFGHFVSKLDPVGTFRFASQQSPIGDEVMEHCEGAKAHALNSILVCDVIDENSESIDAATAVPRAPAWSLRRPAWPTEGRRRSA